jgi:sugar lactone lactonase YvrE
MSATITALDAPLAELGECPVWSPAEAVLHWVDIEGRSVHRHDPATGRTETRTLEGRPGSIALTDEPGRLLVASEHQLLTLTWDDGAVAAVADLEPAATGNRLNDGRCDPAGRFVVGSMYADTGAGETTGVLHQVASTATVNTLRTNIGVTNGLAFDADRGRMYFADTPTGRVLVFDYDLDRGVLSNERVFFDYRDHRGKPDGACVDSEGCYWSASVYGWGLLRITPDGVVEQRLELPLHKPSMPCFGGPDLETMYVTTIGRGGSTPSEPGRDGFEPGAVVVIEGLGVRGVAEPRFG